AEFLGAFDIAVDADRLSRCNAGVEHLRLDILACYNRRYEELRGRIVERCFGSGRLAIQELDGDTGSFSRDDFARLVDRVVLIASDDQLERCDGGVVAGDGR